MTAFSKKLPKPFATDGVSRDAHLLACWRAGQNIITAITNDWDLALTTWNHIEMNMEADRERAGPGWDPSIVNCARLPKYFTGQCLVGADTLALARRFSQDILDRVDAADSKGIRRIFYLHSMGGGWMHVPKPCREDKGLTFEVFQERINAVSGIRDWCGNSIDATTGRIDWLAAGPYRFVWGEDGKATQVRFWFGDVAMVCVEVTRDVSFQEAWDPWQAEVRAPRGLPGTSLPSSSPPTRPRAPTSTRPTGRACR